MANEKTINKRRRIIAAQVYAMLCSKADNPHIMTDKGVQASLAVMSCEAADALMHEFDERGWQ